MRIALILLALLSPTWAAISSLSVPHNPDTATTPKVRYVWQNDSTIQVKVNEIGDSVDLIQAGTASIAAITTTGNATVGGKLTVTDSVRLNNLTASLPVFTDASKRLVSNAMTGTGNVMMSASPTATGTLTAAAANLSGALTLTSASANQLEMTGGTSVTTRIKLNRGSDDATQYMQLGYDRIETVRSATPLASPQTSISFSQVGSDGTRTPLAINSNGTITASTAITLASTATTTGAHTFTAAPIFSSVTASEFLLVDGSKVLTSVAGTGTGSVMRAASPTTTGTLTAAAINASGTVTTDSLISSKFYEEGSFTATLTGVSGSVTATCYWVRVGKTVTLMLSSDLQGTSNTTACTITGMSAAIIPSRQVLVNNLWIVDNSAVEGYTEAHGRIGTDGTITLTANGGPTGFTNSGTKGLATVASSFYPIHYTIKL